MNQSSCNKQRALQVAGVFVSLIVIHGTFENRVFSSTLPLAIRLAQPVILVLISATAEFTDADEG